PTVLDLIPDWGLRVYPVGRLDMDTSGLIILTNDGKMTQNILHPAKKINKVYRVAVKGIPTEEKINLLKKGIEVEGEVFAPAKIRLLGKKGRSDSVWEVIIHEGKKRQVRRMFREIKHPVIDLERTSIDFLSTKGLKEGEWRFLKKEELRRLLGDVKEKTVKPKDELIVPLKMRRRNKNGKPFGKRFG
ncbi:MAG: pseudouridine synthase, partial [Clostridiales bacterium]